MRLVPFPSAYVATIAPPHMRGGWTLNRISMLFLFALLPPLGVVLFEGNSHFLPSFGLIVLVSLAWNLMFARLRRQSITFDWAVTAVSFALFVPVAMPLWQIGLGLSFGIVVGEQLFGGRGWNILNPAIVALAFLAFSFPGTEHILRGGLFAASIIPGAVLLVATGMISWRILIGSALGLAGVIIFSGATEVFSSFSFESAMIGSLVFGLVFFACDPVNAASTNPGRWVYGILTGLLIGLFGLQVGVFGAPTAIIFAILLASIFAPLIDYFAIMLNAHRRRRRHG